MSDRSEALLEVTRFLRDYPPFDALDLEMVERVAAAADVEFHRAGEIIFSQTGDPVAELRVVRSGAVELVHDGRVLDLMGPGELFGHASMLSGMPPGFEARATEDTLCYSIEADVAADALVGPAGVRYVARSLLEASQDLLRAGAGRGLAAAHQPISALIRGEPVVCAPDTTIREAAQLMTAASKTSILVELGDGALGIMTDRDLRSRVIAAGIGGDAPVSAAMSAPAYTCRPDRLGEEVLLEMLDRGFRHLPVVSATGEVLGVVKDSDLVAAHTRSSFFLRQRIGRAQNIDDLVLVAGELRPSVVAMHDGGLSARNVMAVYTVMVEALTRRLVELEVAAAASDGPSSRGWRSAATRDARCRRARTSTARSCGSGTPENRPCAPGCTLSPNGSWGRLSAAASPPTSTGRPRRISSSSVHWSPGSTQSTAGSLTRRRRRR